ncbi:long-chain fatty acid--CoA ligase, partial [Bifidobacterium animalis subsp. lactis]
GRGFAASGVAAQKYMQEVSEKGKARRFVTARRNRFDPMGYSSIRDALGGCAKWIVTGGAPLDPDLMACFRGAGIPVYEGY